LNKNDLAQAFRSLGKKLREWSEEKEKMAFVNDANFGDHSFHRRGHQKEFKPKTPTF